MDTTTDLRLISFNCRSIRNKTHDVISKLEELDTDICMLQETWLNRGDNSVIAEIMDRGYEVKSKRREKGNTGGGVAILFKPHIRLEAAKDKNKYTSFEHIISTLTSRDKLFRIINIYRPDYSKNRRITPNTFFEEFTKMLDEVVILPGILIIVGDLNFHVENTENHYASRFLELLDEYSLHQVIKEPTHENGGTLDLVITSDISSINNISIHGDSVNSDHHPIQFTIKCQQDLDQPVKELWIRDYANLDMDKFKKDLMNSSLLNTTPEDLDDAVFLYDSALKKVLDENCPLIYKKFKIRPNSIWYTEELRELKRKRRALERRFKSLSTADNKEYYREIKRFYNWKLQETRKSFYKRQLNDCKGNTKYLNIIINKLTGKNVDPILPRHGDDKTIADDMSSYFAAKIINIREDIANDATRTTPIDCQAIPDTVTLDTFEQLSETELKDMINDMNSKSCSLDPAPTWLVKSCIEELKHILLLIVNKSLSESTFPSKLKHATIRPTIKDKDGDTEDYGNYRPISNTPFIAKMLEKAALIQIDRHVKMNNLHATIQSGYRRNHSCETAMIKIVNDINHIVENKNMVALILLDLSAAFDTVDHDVLIRKLKNDFGIKHKVIKWIISYLKNRSFSVNVRKGHSNPRFLNFGVPQGSLLGPILFIIYTKDISEIAANHGLSIHLYADDTQLYIGFKPICENIIMSVNSIQACLRDIKCWMATNFLKINPGKTKFIVIGSPYNVRNRHGDDLRLFNEDDKELDKLNTVLSLGVHIDSTMSMKSFVNAKCSEAYYTLRNIGRLKYCLDTSTRIMLVRSLILSKLDYCNAILANIPDYLINRLQRVQNASIRFIYDIKKRDHVSSFLKEAHFLPIKQRIKYKLCLTVHKILNGHSPEYLEDTIKRFEPRKIIRVGRDEHMIEETTACSRSISGKMVEAWNVLPRNLRIINDITTFKRELKTFHFKEAFKND